MKKHLPIVAAMLLFSLHSFGQSSTDAQRCSTQRQCEVMWAKASETVGLVSNMRVRIATENRIETFGPLRSDHVAMLVTRVPYGETGYEIRAQVECLPSDYCANMRREIAKVFEAQLASVK